NCTEQRCDQAPRLIAELLVHCAEELIALTVELGVHDLELAVDPAEPLVETILQTPEALVNPTESSVHAVLEASEALVEATLETPEPLVDPTEALVRELT